MERDDGIDWDAAFEALVAPLRPPRYVRLCRAAGQVGAAVILAALACWTAVRLVAEPLSELGRPWV